MDLRARVREDNEETKWIVVDDLLLYDGRMFVPESSLLWPQILGVVHDSGHEGVQKTLHRLCATFHVRSRHRFV